MLDFPLMKSHCPVRAVFSYRGGDEKGLGQLHIHCHLFIHIQILGKFLLYLGIIDKVVVNTPVHRHSAFPQLATEETILTQDTTFTAKFAQSQICTVTFHDVKDGPEATTSVTVDAGKTLADAIAAAGEFAWSDETPLSQCQWRTVDQEPVELDTPILESADFYTYTYHVVLILNPQDTAKAVAKSSVNVDVGSDGTLTLTITARDGQHLKASDFVVRGVDFSIYQWETADGTILDLKKLIQEGVTEDIVATSTPSAP